MVLDGIDIQRRIIEVGRRGGDELGAGAAEEFLEEREGLGSAALEPGQLVAVFLAQGGVDGVVELGGVEGDAEGDEGVHLVVFLRDAVVLRALLEVFRAADVHEDVGEHADGVGVTAHHHVGEADVVVRREVGGHDAREHGLFVEFDVVEGLEGKAEVAEEAVHAQQADDGKVAEHTVEVAGAVFASDGHGFFVALHGGQLLVNLRALDKGVEDVEDGVAAPGVGVIPEELGFFLVGIGPRNAVTVAAEGFELVDKLVNDIPGPVVLSGPSVLYHKCAGCLCSPKAPPGPLAHPSSR